MQSMFAPLEADSAVRMSLALLNHHPESSSFRPVLPATW